MRLAILATGSGSNTEKIMEYFAHSSKGEIALVASNKADAGVWREQKSLACPRLPLHAKKWKLGFFWPSCRRSGSIG